ncbi:asparaginase [Magnetovibrio sp. PR-2]|uniref:asparaginase n=1 Tax=Magnetovibrio sp. PR-2 TaxID=3120356 RepID=UPI002FCDECEA
MTTPNPVLIEATRGGFVECRYRGACAVVNVKGEILQSWGDVGQNVFPRSSLKPLQAIPLIETGAADAFNVSAQEIALACASHNSEHDHVRHVQAWLARVGLGVDDLECGHCEAITLDVTKSMARDGEDFTRAHNNCSGKHAGFLTTALHLGEDTKNYIKPDHPVQQRITRTVEEMTGSDLSRVPQSADGCGIPVFAFPLSALAQGMASMIAPSVGGAERMASTHRVLSAMAAHPHLVAGTGRFDTRVMETTKGEILVKGGADGVHIAMVPGAGLAIALKIDDGTIRASEQAMGFVLDQLGLLSGEARDGVADLIEKPILNTIDERVGELRGSEAFMLKR